MNTTLYISRNDLVERTSLGGSIDPDRVIPYVYIAQNKWVFQLLGTVLHNKLQTDITNNTLSGVYLTLVNDYIKDTLVWYTMVEYLPFSSYHIAQSGVMRYSPDNTSAVDKKEIDFLTQRALSNAQFYAERMTEYLIANSNIYPEYLDTTGKSDNVFPDKGQQYKSTWVL